MNTRNQWRVGIRSMDGTTRYSSWFSTRTDAMRCVWMLSDRLRDGERMWISSPDGFMWLDEWEGGK